jgi:hypothetical protein
MQCYSGLPIKELSGSLLALSSQCSLAVRFLEQESAGVETQLINFF